MKKSKREGLVLSEKKNKTLLMQAIAAQSKTDKCMDSFFQHLRSQDLFGKSV